MVEPRSCIVIDVGATSIRAGYADAPAPDRVVACPAAASGILTAIGEVVEALRRQWPERRAKVVAVGCPGLIDKGWVKQALYLPLAGINLRRRLEGALSMPVVVANDVSAQALGDLGIATGSSFFAISVGTAVGGAYVRNGVLQGRPGGSMGEIGHLPVSLAGECCPCGGSGCLDLYLAGASLVRALGPSWWLAEAKGEQIETLERAGLALAHCVRTLSLAVDPDYVLLLGRIFANPHLWRGFYRGRCGLGSEIPIAVTRETWPHASRGLWRLATDSVVGNE